MNTTTRRAGTATGAVALLLALTACGSLPGQGDDAGEPEAGPLEKYFEEIYGDFDEESMNAQQMQVEEITAECMREQGFEYIPIDYSTAGGPMPVEEELDVEWGTKEFAEKYGYGITTDPWGNMASEPLPDEGQEFVDPNQEYIESMSEAEAQAYYAALYGEQTFEEGATEEEMVYDWEQAGCSGRAQHEVYESGNGMGEDQFTALQEEMNTMWEASMADPRLAELNSEWASCMADAGYTGLAAVGDAENALSEEVNALWEDAYGGEMSAEMTEEDYRAIEEGIEEARKALTPREIETAVADFDCRDQVDYEAVQREVSVEYQQEFVDAHKDELEAWLEASTSAKG